jgi:hypothetical protein
VFLFYFVIFAALELIGCSSPPRHLGLGSPFFHPGKPPQIPFFTTFPATFNNQSSSPHVHITAAKEPKDWAGASPRASILSLSTISQSLRVQSHLIVPSALAPQFLSVLSGPHPHCPKHSPVLMRPCMAHQAMPSALTLTFFPKLPQPRLLLVPISIKHSSLVKLL